MTYRYPERCREGDAVSCPASTLSRVVLPDPDGPMSASSLPGFASPDTFDSRNLAWQLTNTMTCHNGKVECNYLLQILQLYESCNLFYGWSRGQRVSGPIAANHQRTRGSSLAALSPNWKPNEGGRRLRSMRGFRAGCGEMGDEVVPRRRDRDSPLPRACSSART